MTQQHNFKCEMCGFVEEREHKPWQDFLECRKCVCRIARVKDVLLTGYHREPIVLIESKED